MKRVLCLLLALTVVRTWGQDFASRFMTDFETDTLVQCYTVSPKMMEKLIRIHEEKEHTDKSEQHIRYLLSKLKSARFIIGTRRGERYYKHAEQLMAKNKNRFSLLAEGATESADQHTLLYVRKRDEVIVELVMLSLNEAEHAFNAVNFTGEMDDAFIRLLSRSGNPPNP